MDIACRLAVKSPTSSSSKTTLESSGCEVLDHVSAEHSVVACLAQIVRGTNFDQIFNQPGSRRYGEGWNCSILQRSNIVHIFVALLLSFVTLLSFLKSLGENFETTVVGSQAFSINNLHSDTYVAPTRLVGFVTVEKDTSRMRASVRSKERH